ncbi:MAG: hypothetical protein WBO23_05365 [Burkholderiales bacterium]
MDIGVHTAADSDFNCFTVGRSRSISPRNPFRPFCACLSRLEFKSRGRASAGGASGRALLSNHPPGNVMLTSWNIVSGLRYPQLP